MTSSSASSFSIVSSPVRLPAPSLPALAAVLADLSETITADHGSDQHACQQTEQKMSASFAARPSCRRTRLRRYGWLRLIVRAVHARVPAAWSVIVIIIIVVSVLIQNDSSPSG